jgi:hypothetical protein
MPFAAEIFPVADDNCRFDRRLPAETRDWAKWAITPPLNRQADPVWKEYPSIGTIVPPYSRQFQAWLVLRRTFALREMFVSTARMRQFGTGNP